MSDAFQTEYAISQGNGSLLLGFCVISGETACRSDIHCPVVFSSLVQRRQASSLATPSLVKASVNQGVVAADVASTLKPESQTLLQVPVARASSGKGLCASCRMYRQRVVVKYCSTPSVLGLYLFVSFGLSECRDWAVKGCKSSHLVHQPLLCLRMER